MTGTIGTNDLLDATVTYYNEDKGFGFAEARGQRIFFHQSACREVEGTLEEPQFTTRHSDRKPAWWKGCQYPEQIILRATTSPKGLKASVWGIRPKRTWVENLDHFGTLCQYGGGHVEIRYGERPFGRSLRESHGKFTAEPVLSRNGDQWTLSLSYSAYDGLYRWYGEPSGHVDLRFDLTGASPCKSLPYGRYAMDVYLPEKKEWAHIVFYPPGQWTGN